MIMDSEIERILILVNQAIEHKYLHVETIRQLAETEENYRIIIREVDRVKMQLKYARSYNVPATLTILAWFTILDHFKWKCAYCQSKPFQSMSHLIPQKEGGTTAENCVPACRSCISRSTQKAGLAP